MLAWPARHLCAVHRTFIDPRTFGKAAVEPNKMTLGPVAGGAVRLRDAGYELGLCEGIETGLSAMQLYGGAVWAALGGANVKNVVLPECVKLVIIYGDNGEIGHRFAEEAADTFYYQGRDAKFVFPHEPLGDFNDVAQAQQTEQAK